MTITPKTRLRRRSGAAVAHYTALWTCGMGGENGYGILCHSAWPSRCGMRCEEDAMPTQKVVLAKHQEKLIEILVGSGRYQNASEVLRDGLRLVEQRRPC
jgi:hypothetical protein